MKKLEAILNAHILDAVREVLISRGCGEMIISEVRSAQRETSRAMSYRGIDYAGDVPKIKIETIVADRDAMAIAHAILSVSQNHDASGHTVSLCDVEDVISIGVSKIEEKLTYSLRPHSNGQVVSAAISSR